MILLLVAFVFWLVQQVNDFVGAITNRKNVPKMYWVSAAASLISGAALFAFLYITLSDIEEVIVYIIRFLSDH